MPLSFIHAFAALIFATMPATRLTPLLPVYAARRVMLLYGIYRRSYQRYALRYIRALGALARAMMLPLRCCAMKKRQGWRRYCWRAADAIVDAVIAPSHNVKHTVIHHNTVSHNITCCNIHITTHTRRRHTQNGDIRLLLRRRIRQCTMLYGAFIFSSPPASPMPRGAIRRLLQRYDAAHRLP